MLGKLMRLIFFGNYSIGVLAIALSLETVIQLRLPYNSVAYYILLFCGTVMYYTYAYTGVLLPYSSDNPRQAWYYQNRVFIKYTQLFLLLTCIVCSIVLLIKTVHNLAAVTWWYWLVIAIIAMAVIFYYGLLPRSLIKLNLRNTGWLKAFVIGFVWAASVSFLPIVLLQLERGWCYADPVLIFGLFIKNWMFCSVNAIMFDIKDYEDDTNHQLKTFVVRYGLHNTILFVLTPLCLIGIIFTPLIGQYRHFTILPVLFNVFPFLLLLMVAYAMEKKRNIFFYLVVIDGLVFLKAVCGIAGMAFVSH